MSGEPTIRDAVKQAIPLSFTDRSHSAPPMRIKIRRNPDGSYSARPHTYLRKFS